MDMADSSGRRNADDTPLLRRPVEAAQFVSLAFGQAAAKSGIARSMDRLSGRWGGSPARYEERMISLEQLNDINNN